MSTLLRGKPRRSNRTKITPAMVKRGLDFIDRHSLINTLTTEATYPAFVRRLLMFAINGGCSRKRCAKS